MKRLRSLLIDDEPNARMRLHRLLKEFDAITGVPVLVNTSFNVKGEPIVETPQDAINCFLGTDIDYLAIGDFLVEKSF